MIDTSKVMVVTPTCREPDINTFNSFMGLNHNGQIRVMQGSLVEDAREQATIDAINEGYEHILWIDDDMVFGPDDLQMLMADKKDFISGVFFKRTPPYSPCIYEPMTIDGEATGGCKSYLDYPKNQVFEIEACGCAFTLMSVKALKQIMDEFGTCFHRVNQNGKMLGEDLSVCKRWKALGGKIYCDSRVKIGHIGKVIIDENWWLNVKKHYDEAMGVSNGNCI